MRYIKYTILLAILAVWTAGCEKDSGINIPEARIKVTEANIVFDTYGGEGYIKVEAAGTITAESDQDWCVPNITNKTIHLTVAPNKTMGGRTAIITIRSAGESTTVTALQTNAVLFVKDFDRTISFLSEGSTVKSAIASSYPVTLASKPDWIVYSIQNDTLSITASAGGPRKGTIVVTSEGREITYAVNQVSYAGFLGEWEMKYTNPSTSKEETATVLFTEKEKDESFTLGQLAASDGNLFSVTVDFQSPTNTVRIASSQSLGVFENNNLFFCVRSSTGNASISTNNQIMGKLDFFENSNATLTFKDNKTWDKNIVTGFGFYAFSETPPSAKAYVKTYRTYADIVMTKK